jgi:hypothetical protein
LTQQYAIANNKTSENGAAFGGGGFGFVTARAE